MYDFVIFVIKISWHCIFEKLYTYTRDFARCNVHIFSA